MAIRLLKQFLKLESASGLILLFAASFAIVLANSPFADMHSYFVATSLFTINEGLMAFFFLIVGLELKRNYLEGNLSNFSQIILPLGAAIGGMVIPALLYIMVCAGHPDALRGWATPVATDIAFAVGVLSLFGKRIPLGLKIFLLALAIFDDVGAILIIAIFYSTHIVYSAVFASLLMFAVLLLLNRWSVQRLWPYFVVGIGLWACLLYSGIHPTIAGVLLALTIPDGQNKRSRDSPLQKLESWLHPWVAYLIMPLFALANAGLSFQALDLRIMTDVVVLGIILGLFVGKQLGVFLFSWLLIYLRLARKPEKTSWLALYGVAVLCGIGFTMSLFLGTLSFQSLQAAYLAEVRLGVLLGSLLSGVYGSFVLWLALKK